MTVVKGQPIEINVKINTAKTKAVISFDVITEQIQQDIGRNSKL